MRKTVNVDFVIETVNGMLQNSIDTPEQKSIRMGAILLLEAVLHETGNYKGFRYLIDEEVPHGRPGVRYEDGKHGIRVPCQDINERFADCDDTRRQY
jgi:hypothetical protein